MAASRHTIPVKDAAVLTARWRANMPDGAFKAAMFDKIAFDTLFARPGCVGIRIYMGLKTREQTKDPSLWTFVMCGTDADGNDLVDPIDLNGKVGGLAAAESDDGGGTQEDPKPCPPYCPTQSPLNGEP